MGLLPSTASGGAGEAAGAAHPLRGSGSGSGSGNKLFAHSHAHSPFARSANGDGTQSGSSEKLEPLLSGDGGAGRGASNLMTVFNIVNNYVGMVLLSMHFCFAKCGWLALPLLAVLTAFGAYTGELIIVSYDTVASRGVSVPSYAQIGELCLGTFGKWLVLWSSILETFVAILCMYIITWSNTVLLVPGVALEWVIVGCVVLSLPTNWLRDFSLLAFLSAFGLGSVLLICAVVGCNMYTRTFDPTPLPPTVAARLEGVPMAASIMLAGLTGHVSLPPMYAEMKTPSAFRAVLYTSFALMFGIYALVGACGYVLYGEEASVLITEDMAAAGSDTVLGSVLTALILGCMTFKLFCSVPMCVVTLVDICQGWYHEHAGTQLSESAADVMRLLWWASATLCALLVRSSLQYVTAVCAFHPDPRPTAATRGTYCHTRRAPNATCPYCHTPLRHTPSTAARPYATRPLMPRRWRSAEVCVPSRVRLCQLIGINSMIISVLLPILFYAMLHTQQMSRPRASAYALLVAISLAITCYFSYMDLLEFLDSLAGLVTDQNATTTSGAQATE